MIFVTVGAQMPFDRLVEAVDGWAGRTGRTDVLAQIGPARSAPHYVRSVTFLDPVAFRRCVADATLVVGHAGMGTILTALEYGKRAVVMPRRGDLRETRNDHQAASAERFRVLGRVLVVNDAVELGECLDRMVDAPQVQPIRGVASDDLTRALHRFIHSKARS